MRYKRLLFTVVFCHTRCTQIVVLLCTVHSLAWSSIGRTCSPSHHNSSRVFAIVLAVFCDCAFFITDLQPLTYSGLASLCLVIQLFRLSFRSLSQIIFTVSGILVTCPRNLWVFSSFIFGTLPPPRHISLIYLCQHRVYHIKQPSYNFQFLNDMVFFSICFVSIYI